MSTAKNKAAVRRFVKEVLTKGKIEAIDELSCAELREHPDGSHEPRRLQGSSLRVGRCVSLARI